MTTWRRRLEARARTAGATAVPFAALAIAGASIAVSLTLGRDLAGVERWWILVEPALFIVLAFAAVRWSAPRTAFAAAAALAAATALAMQRYLDGWSWEGAAVSLCWAAGPVAAAAGAVFLRRLDARRVAAVAAARRRQRLDLAADLHDFVAHDVSEIVARAQAGRIVLAGGDERVAALLERIEEAGLRALGSMDRAVGALREDDAVSLAPVGGLADLDGLVERFGSAGAVAVTLERRLEDEVGREAGAVAYRAVAEALTNVRRHAPDAAVVRVAVRASRGVLTVSVCDDGTGAPRRSRAPSGLGLSGIDERAGALGGRVEAGPRGGGGWRTAVVIPLARGGSAVAA